MQLVTMLGRRIESGKLTLSTGDREDVEIVAANKKIDVNVENKEFVREILSAVREGGKAAKPAATEEQGTMRTTRTLREFAVDVAEELKEAGMTVTLSYEGDVVATIGCGANSMLSRLIVGTEAVEINSLPRLLEMSV